MKLLTPLLVLLAFSPSALNARADVQRHSVFSDDMVLQRDKAVSVWAQPLRASA